GTITGNTTVCQGETAVTYTVSEIANATSYVWTLPNGETGTSTTNTITINFENSATSGEISVCGVNECGAGENSTLAITVNALPSEAGAITGNTNVCQGETGVTYIVSEIANATSYVWTLPTGATGSSSTNSITVDFGVSAISGNITVKGVNSCGDGAMSTLAISIDALPDIAGIITGETTVCQGQTAVTYTVPEIANATSYVWTLPSGATGESTTNTITVDYGNSAISGDISVYGTSGCGNGTSSTLSITVNLLPDIAGTITGNTTVCQGETAVTYTVPEIANATSYIWTLPNGATGTSTTNTITVNFENSATSGEISVCGVNECGTGENSTLAITVNSLPSEAGAITGNTNVCQGETGVTYTVPEIANATSYVWTLPTGATGASSTNSIIVDFGVSAISGNITVKGVNSCGDGAMSTLAISIDALPDIAGTITGETTVCQGQTAVAYTVPEIANATSYVWILPNGATGESITNTIIVDYGSSAISGEISVYGVNNCGDGAVSTITITVNPLPDIAGTISGDTMICQGQSSVTYSVPTIANAISYIWTLPEGATGTSTTNSIDVDYGTSAVSGNITVKGVNACGDGESSTLAITVNPLPVKPIITSNSSSHDNSYYCQNDTLVCVNFDNNLLYEWFKDGTEIVTEFSNNAIPLQTSGGYSVKCTDEQTGCHISSDIYEVQVNPVSTLIVHEKHQSEVISLLIVDNKENLFVDYLWSLGDGSDIPSDIVNNRQFVVLPPQHMGKNYMVKVTDIYGCKINSDIISTSLKDFFITLYPTITNSISNVLINHPYEGIIQMRIIDMKGTVISTIDLNKVKSVATFELNFSHLPAGIYTVIFQLGNYTDSHKLFKE
ncbi:MAG TPA: T9SS type A sorting domain-containing protein, partial [Salinivirgaceae bacterium]|nr:T9SS type A sorting domain-containing protein [Salinivirgaceae bacterium]